MKLLEREAERHALQACLRAVGDGVGQLAFISGEAGAGKSALVEAFVSDCDVPDVWGYCDALQTPHALGPVQEIAARVLPSSESRDAAPARLFSALLEAFQRETRARVVVLEDLHWADEATLDFVAWLGRRIRHVRLLFLATYRDDALSPMHPLRRTLGVLKGVNIVRLQLRDLSPQAVAELAAGSGHDGARLYGITAGNPFFVTELLSAAPGEVPETVLDAVLARLARCGQDARAVVEAASLSVGRAERWLLDAALGQSAAGVDEAVERGLLLRDGEAMVFRHELARLAVESALPPARARVLHARMLAALTRHGANLSRLVHHAERAGDAAATFDYARRAADEAAQRESHREAAAHFATALRHADALPAAGRAPLFEAHAREAHLTNEVAAATAAAKSALQLWRELGDVVGQARALLQLSRQYWKSNNRPDAECSATQAMALLEPLPPCHELAMAWTTRSQLAMLAGDVDDALAYGERAVALARGLGATDVEVHALNNVGAALLNMGNASGFPPLERSLEMALAHRLHEDAGRAYANLTAGSMQLHLLQRAEAVMRDGIVHANEHGLFDKALYMRAYQARLELERGRWSAAAAVAAELLDEIEPGSYQRIPTLVVQALVRIRRGDPGADAPLDEALRIALPTGELQRIGRVAAARAERAWLRGDDTGVARETDMGLEAARGHRDPWIIGELQFLRSRVETVQPLEEIAEPYGMMILGDWRAAAGEWERFCMPYERALALMLGPEPALREALKSALELGAEPLATIIRHRLRESGARNVPLGPRAATRSNPAGLTRRELQVLELLFDGLSNAELSKQLHLSIRTVEHHISSIMSKLNVRTRVAAARAAKRLGLTPDLVRRNGAST